MRGPSATTILAGAAVAALALWATGAFANPIDDSTGLEEAGMDELPPAAAVDGSDSGFIDPATYVPPDYSHDPLFSPDAILESIGMLDTTTTPEQRLTAFLYMLRNCEHAAADVASGADYATFFGGSRFTYGTGIDHPVLAGQKQGVPLDFLGPAYAGKVSTAAGAYQITVPTWKEVREAGAWGPRLDDFTPDNQDEAARRILTRAGATPYILSGDLAAAIDKAGTRWASLPTSTARQPQRSMEFALAKYQEGLA